MELSAVLPGVAVGAGKPDGKTPVNDAALVIQHFAVDRFSRILGSESFVVHGPEDLVAQRKAPFAADTEDADGRGGLGGGNSGDTVHRCISFL